MVFIHKRAERLYRTVPGYPAPRQSFEDREGGPGWTAKEVAWAGAVAGPETRDGNDCTRQAAEPLYPQVLPGNGVAGEPYVLQCGRWPQIVDMPARAAQRFEVMPAARSQPAGAEGTADIHVPAPGKRVPAEPADPQLAEAPAEEQKRIGAALRWNFIRFIFRNGHTIGWYWQQRPQTRPARAGL